jgi:serine/threonine-protein kinase
MAGQPTGVLVAGDSIAGYDLEELVGRGATGVMFRARDRRLGRPVALRIVAPELASDSVVRARLNRESTVLAQLDHPNVVPLYEAEDAGGTIVLASRWVDGRSLQALVRRDGPFEPARAARLVAQVAAALQAAHELGIIHRDVKPSNVLVTGADHAYLTDFCLARRDTDTVGLTGPNELVAALDYVAPELIREDEVDRRIDIYGLGLVLYEALTGEVPFPRAGNAAKLYAHLSAEPPSIHARRPEVPVALDAAVRQALAKDPADRQPSAAAFARDALDAIGATRPPWVGETGVPASGEAPQAVDTPRNGNRTPTLVAEHPFERSAYARPSAPVEREGDDPSPPGARRPARTARRLLALLALVLFVAAPVALLLALRDSGRDRDARPAPAPTTRTAKGLAVAAGRVWVATAGRDALQTRPTGGGGRRRAIAVGFGAVRGVAARGDRLLVATDRGLVDIASGDLQRARRIAVTGRVGPLAVGGGSSWAGLADRKVLLRLAGGRVYRIPLRGPASALTVGAGALWVADARAGTVFGVDTATRIARTPKIRVGRRPVALAASRGAVWAVLAGDGSVARIDPRAGRVVGSPIRIPGGPNAIAADSNQIWVTRFRDDAVTRLDARTGRPVGEDRTVHAPVGVALSDDAAWVVGTAGDLTRIPR